MSRVRFDVVFTINEDGSITTNQVTRVNGITAQAGVKFSKGVSFGGVDFHDYQGKDLEIVPDSSGGVVIRGIYADPQT